MAKAMTKVGKFEYNTDALIFGLTVPYEDGYEVWTISSNGSNWVIHQDISNKDHKENIFVNGNPFRALLLVLKMRGLKDEGAIVNIKHYADKFDAAVGKAMEEVA